MLDASFIWERERVTVTSFKDAEHALIACAYAKQEPDQRGPAKIARRFTITHDAWRKSQSAERSLALPTPRRLDSCATSHIL